MVHDKLNENILCIYSFCKRKTFNTKTAKKTAKKTLKIRGFFSAEVAFFYLAGIFLERGRMMLRFRSHFMLAFFYNWVA